ncbi:RNA polymerase sigma factor SigJ [Streptomonospora nanhaiensis]|uniref:RNA polymerase sigma-70 factor (ECF subfamily) n=1 Tax=Streptomonospora nanhaiensis TaxID=1323731 RepID=A0A853BPX6_9ACTN|nr:RNA polymerase sigma factor SigJ [Streptomonospora nanhaiensis]MBV2365769.1 RNA polymerase sigma factor SigJ [Streptomonospora nanhaiensis]MBX9388084.1 RNA polymerase sigma factor SigJ [Streptomonospora nanhaiensis]NYI96472.1 RNA polymerase sigma-70 factor (ECF subfamily) [Streptomonospora nanhaiensis]
MDERDFLTERFLAERFEEHRAHLKAVAYRMLGSLTEADDAVQEVWLRLARSDSGGIGNLGGWLTTVVGRICLDMLRSRTQRGETSLEARLPDPVVSGQAADPEHEALVADSVGLALLVVLESLTPPERLAFVLHDMFGMPFDEIGPIIDRTPVAARKLASRARRRVQGAAPEPDRDPVAQRRVVDAFLTAARDGDFDALVSVLHPDVVLRADGGKALPGGMKVLRGREAVAGQAATFRRMATLSVSRPALVNGTAGLVNTVDGDVFSVMSFTVTGDRITAIEILSDPERLAALDLTGLADTP